MRQIEASRVDQHLGDGAAAAGWKVLKDMSKNYHIVDPDGNQQPMKPGGWIRGQAIYKAYNAVKVEDAPSDASVEQGAPRTIPEGELRNAVLGILGTEKKMITVGDSVAYRFAEDYLKNQILDEPLLINRAESSTGADRALAQVSVPRTGEWVRVLEPDLPSTSFVFISTGTNDLKDKNPDAIARDLKAFVNGLKRFKPYLRAAFCTPTRREDVVPVVKPDTYEGVIKTYFDDDDLRFVCLSRQDVGLEEGDFEDNLHPNAEGYSKIARALVKKLPPALTCQETPPREQAAPVTTQTSPADQVLAKVEKVLHAPVQKEKVAQEKAAAAAAARSEMKEDRQARDAIELEEGEVAKEIQRLQTELTAKEEELEIKRRDKRQLDEKAQLSRMKSQKLDAEEQEAKAEAEQAKTRAKEVQGKLSEMVSLLS